MNLTKKINEKKILLIKKENIYVFFLIFLIFTLDRISKIEIINNFSTSPFFINNFINFDLIWNTGIGFGLLSSDSNLIYNSVSVVIGLVILVLLSICVVSKKLDKLIFSVIIGGAIGNFYDRLLYKAVPDFIDVHYNNFHWFTFNVADIFITLGIVIFLINGFFVKN
jgi:signal peptidase II|tara:strand:+ start:433 stop:933 length:501 start_codon:yes stop_codon:yes gene_type:complete